MAASTITRVVWTDGAAGTVINNARKNSDIYDKVDEMFAGAGSYATFTLGGKLSVEGGQIVFPAAQASSSDANTLDDYEEGTWTPTIGGAGGTSGQVYSSQLGIYNKVGNMVTCWFTAILTTKGTITGVVQIGGLPFTANSTVHGVLAVSYFEGLATSVVDLSGFVSPSTSAATLYVLTAAAIGKSTITTTDIANNTGMFGLITYRASA